MEIYKMFVYNLYETDVFLKVTQVMVIDLNKEPKHKKPQ